MSEPIETRTVDTVGELIEELKKFPPETSVCVDNGDTPSYPQLKMMWLDDYDNLFETKPETDGAIQEVLVL